MRVSFSTTAKVAEKSCVLVLVIAACFAHSVPSNVLQFSWTKAVVRFMATTDLKLDEPGSLPRPGPIGRLVRLALGALWLWEFYVFADLGSAFVLAAIIGTPGCEMRALHDLYSRLTGNPTKEHYCPIGPLHPIDQWEAHRDQS